MSRHSLANGWATEDIPCRGVVVSDRRRHGSRTGGNIATRCRCWIRNRDAIVFVTFDETIVRRWQVDGDWYEWIAIARVGQRRAVKGQIAATCNRCVDCCYEIRVVS